MNDEVYVIFEGHAQVDYDDYYQCWDEKECTDEDDHPVHNDSVVVKAYKVVSPHEDDMDYCRVEKWNTLDKAEVPS